MPDAASAFDLRFVNYFGELGPRWGLPKEACRIHALLYLLAQPTMRQEIATCLSIEPDEIEEAIDFLVDYKMIEGSWDGGWRTSGNPWDMLIKGLEERRDREMPLALSVLRDCHAEALSEEGTQGTSARQIEKMLSLVEDLAAIDAQARRISPELLRGLVSISGKASRFVDKAFGGRDRKS